MAIELSDSDLIAATLKGDQSSYEALIRKYQPRIFGTVRRYARRPDEIEDIVQEIFTKAWQKLASYRGEAPFEHWLMRLAVRTCYDFLRVHQKNREINLSDIGSEELDWLEKWDGGGFETSNRAAAARELIQAVLEHLSPPARLVITLLEIEERSVKEIAQLTGWSAALVKVRAFRARAEMRKILEKLSREKYL